MQEDIDDSDEDPHYNYDGKSESDTTEFESEIEDVQPRLKKHKKFKPCPSLVEKKKKRKLTDKCRVLKKCAKKSDLKEETDNKLIHAHNGIFLLFQAF